MDLYRKAFVFSYITRGRYRTSRRSIGDVLRLGVLARELTSYYLYIVRWEKFDRILRISI